MIRNQCNQVPHLSQDTKRESNTITKDFTNKSQEVSPFPAGEHKAAMNRRESMTSDPQKKYRLGTVNKIFYSQLMAILEKQVGQSVSASA